MSKKREMARDVQKRFRKWKSKNVWTNVTGVPAAMDLHFSLKFVSLQVKTQPLRCIAPQILTFQYIAKILKALAGPDENHLNRNIIN